MRFTLSKQTSRLIFLGLVISALSFYIRFNYMPFVQNLGTYEGDLWYFFTYYGYQIQNNFFFRIEYPVGYVIILKLASIIATTIFGQFNYQNFIWANVILMAPLICGVIILVQKIAAILKINKKISILFILLSPTFFIASTTNYDIFPVFFTLLAIYLILKKHFTSAIIFLSLGTIIKLYPGFLLPGFCLYQYSKVSSKFKVFINIILFLALVSCINLPFMLYNFDFWKFPYLYQSSGNPQRLDPNTLSYYLIQIGLEKLRTAFLAFFIIISWLISYLFFHYKKMSDKNFLFLLYLTVFSAVFANQVNTPQYVLWFLPLIALTQFPSFFVWIIFDIINSSVLYFYFKLHNQVSGLIHLIFFIIVAYFIFLYSNLLLKLNESFQKSN